MTAMFAKSLPLLLGLSSLAGCSLLYNPNNLSEPKDSGVPPIDTPTDINVEMPMITAVGPADLFEGQGTGGSRQAVLAVVGGNIGPDAIVELLGEDGAPVAPAVIEVDNAHAVRSLSGAGVAVPVTVPVDTAVADKDTKLTVRVTQMGATAMVSGTLADAVTLHNLRELTAPVATVTALAPAYARVELTMPLVFTPAASAAAARVRAYGDIVLTEVHSDGGNPTPGPGGAGGGADGNSDGGGPGGGRHGVILTSTASGGGYGEKGLDGANNPGGPATGDDLITNFASNGGSGGGGKGGGGGGSIEITAGGTLTVGKVSANGGAGGSGNGGGSGGAIILRTGASMTLSGTLTTTGGMASNAGGGGKGRIRYDSPQDDLTPVVDGVARRGAVFDVAAELNPLITTKPRQTFQLVSAPSSTQFNIYVVNAAGVTTDSGTVLFGSPTAIYTPRMALNAGYNQICVTPPAGNPTLTESANCISVAYVP